MEKLQIFGKAVVNRLLQILIGLAVLAGMGVILGLYSKIVYLGFDFGWNLI